MDGIKGNEKWLEMAYVKNYIMSFLILQERKGPNFHENNPEMEYERVCTVRRRKHSGRLKMKAETSLVSEMPNEQVDGIICTRQLEELRKAIFQNVARPASGLSLAGSCSAGKGSVSF